MALRVGERRRAVHKRAHILLRNGAPISGGLVRTTTDPKQACLIGLRDGYQLTNKELQDETDKAINRLEAAELDAQSAGRPRRARGLRALNGADAREHEPANSVETAGL